MRENRTGSILFSQAWIDEKNKLLKEKLPLSVCSEPFYPDSYFYEQYYEDHLKGLHFMSKAIFSFLQIEPSGCIVDFYYGKDNPKNLYNDTAGFYTKIKDKNGIDRECILINSRHKNNPLAVGAILAHEMMHLYLSRLNIKIENTQENELLTDLATIQTGFSILILNGMAYSSEWWLTLIMLIFGSIYWSSKQVAFGYFKPEEYGKHALSWFKERNISIDEIFNYMNPKSRYFIQHGLFLRPKNPTDFVKHLQKQNIKANAVKGGIAAIIVIPILIWSISSGYEKSMLKSQVQDCKLEISILENKINGDQLKLDGMKTQLNRYKNDADVDSYNILVELYNSRLKLVKGDISEYNSKLLLCNNLINQYNNR